MGKNTIQPERPQYHQQQMPAMQQRFDGLAGPQGQQQHYGLPNGLTPAGNPMQQQQQDVPMMPGGHFANHQHVPPQAPHARWGNQQAQHDQRWAPPGIPQAPAPGPPPAACAGCAPPGAVALG